ncbi:LOW QUALITY PROTEIN: hypothetical protein KIPB_001039 [Kipferlia bialata]|uniref:Uncharacterized protein n=1 Tax=Kipferlia bialata TaxID=797122 RepID=A0A9K3CNA8_9EUKA|nr:LOW QUALITY PROTEIN: hypothetical protein KIPB_001039 [Kipferlia bialata]
MADEQGPLPDVNYVFINRTDIHRYTLLALIATVGYTIGLKWSHLIINLAALDLFERVVYGTDPSVHRDNALRACGVIRHMATVVQILSFLVSLDVGKDFRRIWSIVHWTVAPTSVALCMEGVRAYRESYNRKCKMQFSRITQLCPFVDETTVMCTLALACVPLVLLSSLGLPSTHVCGVLVSLVVLYCIQSTTSHISLALLREYARRVADPSSGVFIRFGCFLSIHVPFARQCALDVLAQRVESQMRLEQLVAPILQIPPLAKSPWGKRSARTAPPLERIINLLDSTGRYHTLRLRHNGRALRQSIQLHTLYQERLYHPEWHLDPYPMPRYLVSNGQPIDSCPDPYVTWLKTQFPYGDQPSSGFGSSHLSLLRETRAVPLTVSGSLRVMCDPSPLTELLGSDSVNTLRIAETPTGIPVVSDKYAPTQPTVDPLVSSRLFYSEKLFRRRYTRNYAEPAGCVTATIAVTESLQNQTRSVVAELVPVHIQPGRCRENGTDWQLSLYVHQTASTLHTLGRVLSVLRGVQGGWFSDSASLALTVAAMFTYVDRPPISEAALEVLHHPLTLTHRNNVLNLHACSIFLLLEQAIPLKGYYPGFRDLVRDTIVGTTGSAGMPRNEMHVSMPVKDAVGSTLISHTDPGPSTPSGIALRHLLSALRHIGGKSRMFADWPTCHRLSLGQAKEDNATSMLDQLLEISTAQFAYPSLMSYLRHLAVETGTLERECRCLAEYVQTCVPVHAEAIVTLTEEWTQAAKENLTRWREWADPLG